MISAKPEKTHRDQPFRVKQAFLTLGQNPILSMGICRGQSRFSKRYDLSSLFMAESLLSHFLRTDIWIFQFQSVNHPEYFGLHVALWSWSIAIIQDIVHHRNRYSCVFCEFPIAHIIFGLNGLHDGYSGFYIPAWYYHAINLLWCAILSCRSLSCIGMIMSHLNLVKEKMKKKIKFFC